MPPAAKSKKIPDSATGGVTYLIADDKNVAYSVGSIPVTAAAQKIDNDRMFDGMRDGWMKAVPGGKAMEEKAYSFDGNPGREVTVVGNTEGQQVQFMLRLFRVENRYYMLTYGSVVDRFIEKDRKRFFDS